MHWLILVFAALAALAAGGFLWWRTKVGAELGLMAATETSKAGDIAGKPVGTVVELKGAIRTDAPLTAEFSGQTCVYYRSMVEREVQRTRRDSNGKMRTERVYEAESDTTKNAPARIDDGTGSVVLEFEGATVEAVEVHRRREGAGAMGVAAAVLGGGVLGYRYTEWAIAPDAAVYVLATVRPGGAVGRPPEKTKAPFVISTKSEEERTKSLTSTRFWLLVGAVVFGLAAAGLIWLAIYNWPAAGGA